MLKFLLVIEEVLGASVKFFELFALVEVVNDFVIICTVFVIFEKLAVWFT